MLEQSPVMTMSAQPDQYFASSHYTNTSLDQSIESLQNPFTPNASIPPTPGSLAGRKRSRGDSFDDAIEPDGSLPTPVEEAPFQQAITGSSMILDRPNPGQSTTVEDQSSEPRPFSLQHINRPSISSRKSQRRDTASSTDNLAQLVLPSNMREATLEPLIDEATRVLGISWTRMDSSESLLINQAAYAKFIQNHYPSLEKVTVWFENSALPGYLVVAINAHTQDKEYYLFSQDLLEARLVTREAADLLPRLQMLPAIELAAPAGQLRAELASVSAPKYEMETNTTGVFPALADSLHSQGYDDESSHNHSPDPSHDILCSAHQMELD